MNATRNARQAAMFLGVDRDVSTINMEDVDNFIGWLRRQGNSPATINRKLSALSKVLRMAYERGKMAKRLRLPRQKEALNRIRFLSDEEEAVLIGTMERLGYTEHADAVRILLYTGFRCSELWHLQWRDVDLKRKTITLWKTKTGRARTIPIVPRIYNLVALYVKRAMATNTSRLFPDGGNDWLHNAWFRVRELMGMDSDPQFTPHMLRHTCATRLAQRGVSIPVIKDWLGHTYTAPH